MTPEPLSTTTQGAEPSPRGDRISARGMDAWYGRAREGVCGTLGWEGPRVLKVVIRLSWWSFNSRYEEDSSSSETRKPSSSQ
eukprot:5689200-Prymnesium_polylepis.1